MIKLLVEGWRSIPHSYAVVNQFQCLEFLKRRDIKLYHRDMPKLNLNWKSEVLFDENSEHQLKNIPDLSEKEVPNVLLRIDFPHRLNPIDDAKVFVFTTSEYYRVPKASLVQDKPLKEQLNHPHVFLVTPSRWSREGILRSGVDPNKVFLIPHGVDTSLFYPLSEDERKTLRKQLAVDGFLFLNLGAMTANKGIDTLLKAFVTIAENYPDAHLVLKGLGALYPSSQFFQAQAANLTPAEKKLIEPRIRYFSNTLNFKNMAYLYQALDAYVSPYTAEGFNLPVLEAIACGMPVICTEGCPTNDFTEPDFALKIASERVEAIYPDDSEGCFLSPSLDSLINQMTRVIEDADFRKRARETGPTFVINNFQWSHTVDKFIKIFRWQ